LLNSMRSGQFNDGIKPGLSSYTACMFSAMQDADWKGVIELNEQMMTDGIPPSDASVHGALLASSRLVDHSKALELMHEAAENKVGLNLGSLRHCMALFLPEYVENVKTLTDIREAFRAFAKKCEAHDKNDIAASQAMKLSKSIRMAEIEGSRLPSDSLKKEDILERQHALWRDILIQFHELAKNLDSNTKK